jgi:hypothetical protein
LTAIRNSIDQTVFRPNNNKIDQNNIRTILDNLNICGDEIERLESHIIELYGIIVQPITSNNYNQNFENYGLENENEKKSLPLSEKYSTFSFSPTFATIYSNSTRLSATTNDINGEMSILSTSFDNIVKEYEYIQIKVEEFFPQFLIYFGIQIGVQNDAKVSKERSMGALKSSHPPNLPTATTTHSQTPTANPNLVSLLTIPSLSTILAQHDNTNHTLNKNNPKLNLHQKSSKKVEKKMFSPQTTKKSATSSTILQQQLLTSLERSRATLSHNLTATQQSFDTLLISSEVLQQVNSTAISAKENSTLSERLTKRHEIQAIIEKKMVRWSFLVVCCVAAWIVVRRVLWFATPVVYMGKASLYGVSWIQAVLLWLLSWIWG